MKTTNCPQLNKFNLMKIIKPLEKNFSNQSTKLSLRDPSKLLAEFFNGVVIKNEEEYFYES